MIVPLVVYSSKRGWAVLSNLSCLWRHLEVICTARTHSEVRLRRCLVRGVVYSKVIRLTHFHLSRRYLLKLYLALINGDLGRVDTLLKSVDVIFVTRPDTRFRITSSTKQRPNGIVRDNMAISALDSFAVDRIICLWLCLGCWVTRWQMTLTHSIVFLVLSDVLFTGHSFRSQRCIP